MKIYKKYFLVIDFIFCLLITFSLIVWSKYFNGFFVISNLLENNRANIYGTLATIFGTLLGFVITGLSIVVGYSTDQKLKLIRDSASYKQLWNTFLSTIKILAISTIMCIVALVWDNDQTPNEYILYIMFFFTLLSALRMWKIVWVLEELTKILTLK
jgi:hypothetical protein